MIVNLEVPDQLQDRPQFSAAVRAAAEALVQATEDSAYLREVARERRQREFELNMRQRAAVARV